MLGCILVLACILGGTGYDNAPCQCPMPMPCASAWGIEHRGEHPHPDPAPILPGAGAWGVLCATPHARAPLHAQGPTPQPPFALPPKPRARPHTFDEVVQRGLGHQKSRDAAIDVQPKALHSDGRELHLRGNQLPCTGHMA